MTFLNKTATTIFTAAVILVTLDLIFLSLNSDSLSNQITLVQRVVPQIRYEGAVICYALVIAVIYYFILKDHKSPTEAFFLGAIINGIYETTNYATLKKWKIETVAKDTIWGGLLFAVTTWATYKIV